MCCVGISVRRFIGAPLFWSSFIKINGHREKRKFNLLSKSDYLSISVRPEWSDNANYVWNLINEWKKNKTMSTGSGAETEKSRKWKEIAICCDDGVYIHTRMCASTREMCPLTLKELSLLRVRRLDIREHREVFTPRIMKMEPFTEGDYHFELVHFSDFYPSITALAVHSMVWKNKYRKLYMPEDTRTPCDCGVKRPRTILILYFVRLSMRDLW